MHQPQTMEFVPKAGNKFTSELPARVETALRSSPQLCGCVLACEQQGGAMVLTGSVGSFYLKQIAQTVAGSVEGVDRVVNHVSVERV